MKVLEIRTGLVGGLEVVLQVDGQEVSRLVAGEAIMSDPPMLGEFIARVWSERV